MYPIHQFVFELHIYGKSERPIPRTAGAAMSGALVKSAARVFEILEHFGRERRPMRLVDLARAIDCPTSSVAALLKSMTAQGFLSFDPSTHAYMPTSRLPLLVSWIPMRSYDAIPLIDAMENLQRSTGELIVLAVESGLYVEYVRTLASSEGLQLYVAPGTRRLMVQTGTGWQFLNRRPRDEALAIYARTVAQGEVDGTRFTRQDFLDCLNGHRNRDVSFVRARDLVVPVAHWGGGMVSMLLPERAGYGSLALGVGGPADRLEARLETISEALRVEIARLAEEGITSTSASIENH